MQREQIERVKEWKKKRKEKKKGKNSIILKWK